MYLDATLILLLPVLAFAGWAQMKVKSTFRELQDVEVSSGYAGREVARQILDANGLHDLPVEEVQGTLSDHFDPTTNVVRLSTPVYHGHSIAAASIAAHEVGHAIQHAEKYAPMEIRSGILPIARLGSGAAIPLFFLGFLFSFPALMMLGILVFTGAVLFQVVTLPVEINASNRGVNALVNQGFIVESEYPKARKILNAAALTYVASALMAVMQLIRLIILRNSRS